MVMMIIVMVLMMLMMIAVMMMILFRSPASANGDTDSVVAKLRREVEALKKKFCHSEREWAEVR